MVAALSCYLHLVLKEWRLDLFPALTDTNARLPLLRTVFRLDYILCYVSPLEPHPHIVKSESSIITSGGADAV